MEQRSIDEIPYNINAAATHEVLRKGTVSLLPLLLVETLGILSASLYTGSGVHLVRESEPSAEVRCSSSSCQRD